ncbi:F1F0 ATP synthase subunit 4 [Saccharomycopsis crataegensis]|uniref:ATP synthase subunit 4 n=1 Tax=Saccharomycopsis crataegensis TaxID=43959 RepID=A0AAV5QEX5_9ASCO|nr:F1F0 ATP synthase subunit 4 [Saccharomycopsis crataegensis]
MSFSRIALRSAFNARPAGVPASVRCFSTSRLALQQEDPKAKAASIIDVLPGNNAISKTGILATVTAGLTYAVSNQLYIVNEETILAGTFFAFSAIIAKVIAPLYKDFADARVKSVTDILNASRANHVEAVQSRIDSVSQLKDVVSTTNALFDVSKETVELEAKAFELKQKVDLAAEAKATLDSWVRYEANVRQQEQEQLAKTVIAKVEKEITNPKFQDKILQQAVAEVEKVFAAAK